MKKTIALIISVILVVAIFASCAPATEDVAKTNEETEAAVTDIKEDDALAELDTSSNSGLPIDSRDPRCCKNGCGEKLVKATTTKKETTAKKSTPARDANGRFVKKDAAEKATTKKEKPVKQNKINNSVAESDLPVPENPETDETTPSVSDNKHSVSFNNLLQTIKHKAGEIPEVDEAVKVKYI